ncbi:MAG: class I SAM-dependent methyltransferase [Novosphingobium sp.]|nr:class I SAM-dependent methyltransferase [Novosphingobium sp.]
MGIAGWYDEHVLPRIIKLGCGQKGIADRRAQVVPRARGRVFEIGCGGGMNQPLYDPQQVTGFAGIDPSAKLLDYAREQAALKGWDADIRRGFGENIPFADEEFDTVVCTYTLCSVDNNVQVLSELRRILKPGGLFLFLEHGRAPDPGVQRWQQRIEPVWKRLMGGCHLTRPITDAVRDAGFSVTPIDQGYMKGMPRIASWMEWGEAVKSG